MLNLVGWEDDEEEYETEAEEDTAEEEEDLRPSLFQSSSRRQNNKIVNIHSTSQFKVVVTQPEDFEDAREICDHLKNKKPIIANLENLEKDVAQRILDFLSGTAYALDGSIQRISNGIFLIAPHNVDVLGNFNNELKNKSEFPWMK